MSTIDRPLDELYFEWLYGHIGPIKLKNKSKSYWELSRQLFQTEFVWFIPNDDNRSEDGRDLRLLFIDEYRIDDIDLEWLSMGCSMLELLIGLSKRLEFEAGGRARFWFWSLIDNIGLTGCNDRAYDMHMRDHIGDVLDTIIWRTYTRRGHGGLFPLGYSRRDQRNEELWYQLSAYLLERDKAKGG